MTKVILNREKREKAAKQEVIEESFHTDKNVMSEEEEEKKEPAVEEKPTEKVAEEIKDPQPNNASGELQELAQPVVENPDDGKPPESAT
jgi:hypothetical protein